jgi:hypothetical protein
MEIQSTPETSHSGRTIRNTNVTMDNVHYNAVEPILSQSFSVLLEIELANTTNF